MKKIVFVALAALLPCFAWAQFSVSGKISEQKSSEPLVGASVSLNGTLFKTLTDGNGRYSINNVKPGNYKISISYLGYIPASKSIAVTADYTQDFLLIKSSIISDEVQVRATRAAVNSATTYRNLSKEELAKNNLGQDLPYLLNQTPSVVVSSDAGAGIGYTGLRIRGSDATRINVTLNGIPLNDAESQGSFFINLPDLSSSVDNIQIQRGVGTSTNGAGAFGASLNIQTTTRRDSAYAEINNTYGSYDTWKNTVNVGSGLINGKFSLDGRLSRIKSDGYIDRAFSNLKSFFVSGAFYGQKDLVRVNVFSGTEKTYQAWNGVSEDILNSGNRTHNDFTYDNQTDNYTQDHYQAFYTHTFSEKLLANVALHYTYGRGYYEEYKAAQSLADYNIAPVVLGATTITESDLVRRLWLDNDFYGTTYSLSYTPNIDLNFTLGGAYNEYKGKHFDEVIWAQYANYSGSNSIRYRYSDNDAKKTDFNVFGKASYRLNQLNFYADMQYRRINYSFLGFDRNKNNVQQQDELNFFNPKVGLTYNFSSNSNVYASFAVGNKEPNRNDYTESTPDSRPKAERLNNFEAGYRFASPKINAGINGYAMLYKNQLVVTGQLNDVGSQTRQNVADSYRIGIELDGKVQLTKLLSWAATASLSQNKIKDYTKLLSVYDANYTFVGQQSTTYANTDIAYSPNFIASSEISFNPVKGAEIALLSKYVSSQFLDNTSDDSRKLDGFFVNDVRLRYSTPLAGLRQVGVSLLVNNLFSEKYSAAGATYPEVFDGTLYNYNYYYPQATRNFLVALNLTF